MTVKESLVSSNNRDDFLPNYQKPSLFMTPAWQNAWWEHYGDSGTFLKVTEDKLKEFQLYIDKHKRWKFLPIRTLEFCGTNHATIITPRAEYLGLNSNNEVEQYILNSNWDEFIVKDVLVGSEEDQYLLQLAKENSWSTFQMKSDISYLVDTNATDFSNYLKNLGGTTRRRLFNQRVKFEKKGGITFSDYWPNRVDEFFRILNEFHRHRFGVPVYSKRTQSMLKLFMEEHCRYGGGVVLEAMMLANQPVSVSFDVVWKNRIYNLQSGFTNRQLKGVSLGLLHLGYRIQKAFNDIDIHAFDLMCGYGKHANYKKSLATHYHPCVSYRFVRNRLYQFLLQTILTLKSLMKNITIRIIDR